MRRRLEDLWGLVTGELGYDVLSDEVFTFLNRRRYQVELIVWDRMGYVIYNKRLEQGWFERTDAG